MTKTFPSAYIYNDSNLKRKLKNELWHRRLSASGNGSLVPVGPSLLQVTAINSGPTINYNHLKAVKSNQKQAETDVCAFRRRLLGEFLIFIFFYDFLLEGTEFGVPAAWMWSEKSQKRDAEG